MLGIGRFNIMRGIEMELLIKLLDIVNTLLEILILYACAKMLCRKNMQMGWHRYIPYIGTFFLIYFITWVVPMDTTKIILEMLVWCLLTKIITKDKWRNLIVAFLLSFYIIAAISFLDMTLSQVLFGTNTIILGEQVFLIWQDYILGIFLRMLTAAGLLTCGKHFQCEIRIKDAAVIGSVTLIFYALCFSIGSGFFAGNTAWYNMVSATSAMLFCICFLLLLLFYRNNLYLKEQKLNADRQASEARMQYQYYLEKEKQSEKVRSIYHDMKNHLLLLEREQASTETRRITEKLLNEIADYEYSIQSGNNILDIIINDKAQKAKEKQIDFSTFLDFSEITFIEPLDISTIFGNAIDNAFEASIKLSPEKRIVIVKGGRRENFVLIRMENNFTEKEPTAKQPVSEKNSFLHGFGIPNIKRAVQKYDGECQIQKKDGRFTLTIIIPFPVP